MEQDMSKRIVKIRYSQRNNIKQLKEIKLMLNTEIYLIEQRIKELQKSAASLEKDSFIKKSQNEK